MSANTCHQASKPLAQRIFWNAASQCLTKQTIAKSQIPLSPTQGLGRTSEQFWTIFARFSQSPGRVEYYRRNEVAPIFADSTPIAAESNPQWVFWGPQYAKFSSNNNCDLNRCFAHSLNFARSLKQPGTAARKMGIANSSPGFLCRWNLATKAEVVMLVAWCCRDRCWVCFGMKQARTFARNEVMNFGFGWSTHLKRVCLTVRRRCEFALKHHFASFWSDTGTRRSAFFASKMGFLQ